MAPPNNKRHQQLHGAPNTGLAGASDFNMNDVGVWAHKMPAMYCESALAIYNLVLGRSFM
jgi:hypothetical protein